MIPRTVFAMLLVGALFLSACGEEDRSQAELGAIWLTEHRLHQPFGPIGKINKITVESAKLIRMYIDIPDKRHADAIDAQSLMFQSMVAKYACPSKGADLWPLLGQEISLRVDLMTGSDHVASAICEGPKVVSGG
jgi:hypothetical protein